MGSRKLQLELSVLRRASRNVLPLFNARSSYLRVGDLANTSKCLGSKRKISSTTYPVNTACGGRDNTFFTICLVKMLLWPIVNTFSPQNAKHFVVSCPNNYWCLF